jgi:hypothetical protein
LIIKRLSVYTFAFSLRDFFYFAPFARKNASEFHAIPTGRKQREERKGKTKPGKTSLRVWLSIWYITFWTILVGSFGFRVREKKAFFQSLQSDAQEKKK